MVRSAERETYTVAGTLLTGAPVIEATADAYAEAREEEGLLAERLTDALAAGQAEGGDEREDLTVQSAAVVVANTQEGELHEPFYDDLRVDATETPIAGLRETYQLARQREEAVDRYEEEDDG